MTNEPLPGIVTLRIRPRWRRALRFPYALWTYRRLGLSWGTSVQLALLMVSWGPGERHVSHAGAVSHDPR